MKSAADQQNLPKFQFVTDPLGEVSEVREIKYKYEWSEEAKGLRKVPRSHGVQVWKREEE